MRIHHLITKSDGGAANATHRLHHALGAAGVESAVFHAYGSERGKGWRRGIGRPRKTFRSRFQRLLLSWARQARQGPIALANCGVKTQFPGDLGHCDALLIHWIGDHLLDFDSFSVALPPKLPIIWRLADLNALTALCHYPGDCRQFLEPTGCRCCPFFSPTLGAYLTKSSNAAKQRFFERHSVHLVTISEWEHALALRSTLGRSAKSISLIHNPFFPNNSSAPLARNKARALLNMEQSALWVCYGAANASTPRKGLADFIASVPLLRQSLPNIQFAIVGDGDGHPDLRALTGAKLFGALPGDKLELVLSACDVFAMPTHEEALGQMGLEAISQGTPTVCYSDSGPCSYVIEGKSGIQVQRRTADAFAGGLLQVLSDLPRFSQDLVRDFYLTSLEKKFSAQNQIKRYISLFEQVKA